jgi:hypothetical protein
MDSSDASRADFVVIDNGPSLVISKNAYVRPNRKAIIFNTSQKVNPALVKSIEVWHPSYRKSSQNGKEFDVTAIFNILDLCIL